MSNMWNISKGEVSSRLLIHLFWMMEKKSHVFKKQIFLAKKIYEKLKNSDPTRVTGCCPALWIEQNKIKKKST